MNKKIVKIGLYSLLSLATLSSCNRLLDGDDPSKITEESATSSLSSLEKINRGFYTGIPTAYSWYVPSLITDELVINTTDNLGGGTGFYGWSYGPGTVEDRDITLAIFRGYYSVIRRANLTINNIDSVPTISSSDVAKKNLLKAEAFGMRAFAHYQLMQLFSPKYDASALGVAYVTEVNDNALPSRDNMQTSYNKILADLNVAETAFTAAGLNNDNTRINKAAIAALKAKVYLELGDYGNAITFADQVLNGTTHGTYNLTTATNYANVWKDVNDYNEVIFKQANTDEASSTTSGTLFENTSGQIQYNASATLLSKYNASDVRRTDLFITRAGGIISGKYLLPSESGVRTTKGRADVKLIRTAEIYLLRAEAYARLGNTTNAYNDYLTLRNARNAGSSTPFTSQSDALDKILEERDRELAYEGFRLADVKRFGKTIIRQAADSRPGYTELAYPNVSRYPLPIPYREVFANPNIQQNEGWR